MQRDKPWKIKPRELKDPQNIEYYNATNTPSTAKKLPSLQHSSSAFIKVVSHQQSSYDQQPDQSASIDRSAREGLFSTMVKRLGSSTTKHTNNYVTEDRSFGDSTKRSVENLRKSKLILPKASLADQSDTEDYTGQSGVGVGDNSTFWKKKDRAFSKKQTYEFMKKVEQQVSDAFNTSREKNMIEDLKMATPAKRKITRAFEKIQDLRKIKENTGTYRHRDITSPHSVQANKSLNPIATSRAAEQIYHMSTTDKFDGLLNRVSTLDVTSKLQEPSIKQMLADDSDMTKEDELNLLAIQRDWSQGLAKEKLHTEDVFEKFICYENQKMPFSLALMAKMRRKIFTEVKHQAYDSKDPLKKTFLMNMRTKVIPSEKAKFIEKLDEFEKVKKYTEMQSKKANSSALYQLIAMDKTSQKRLKSRMIEKFPLNSRFLQF